MNNITLMGRLTRDVEIKTTGSGLKVANFTLAVDREFVKKDSDSDEPTADFLYCVAWRNSAEYLEKYSQKGARILVNGRVQNRSWEDEDGDTHYVTEIICNSVTVIDYKEAEKSVKSTGKKYRK